MRRSPFATLIAVLLPLLVTVLSACGATAKLLPAGAATRLDDQLQATSSALTAGDCTQAIKSLGDAQATFASLPATVDNRLRARLRDGLDHVAKTLPAQCVATGSTDTTTTPSTDTTGTTGATDATTDTTTSTPTTPDTTPTTPTTPTATTPTAPTTTTPTAPTGGVSPDGGTPTTP